MLYRAFGHPNTNPAPAKINTLMNNTICPTDNGDFSLSRMATISVPSSEPPDRITSPTPTPRINPPNTAPSKGSPGVNAGTWCNNDVPMDMTTIPSSVDNANVLP